MHRYGLRTATAYTLLRQVTAQLATCTVNGEFHHAQPVPTDLELRRRRLDSDLTSGTITITIAPDETCGFDEYGDPVGTCSSNRHCSWESGRLNLFFCGIQSLFTTCLDSTSAFDTDLCDDACQSNSHNAFCTKSLYPSCVELAVGDDITAWVCLNVSTRYSIDTTQSLEDREFKTLILASGTPISTFISADETDTLTTKPTDTTTTTSSTSTPPAPGPDGEPNVGAIVGGVVGGLTVISLTVLGVLYLRRRKHNQSTHKPNSGPATQVQPEPSIQDTHDAMASTQAGYGAALNSPVKSQRQSISPPPSFSPHARSPTTYAPPVQQEPSPGAVEMYELDEDRTGHHHGSMQEMY